MTIQQMQAMLVERLRGLTYTGLHVLFIAVVFEFLAWWIGRRIDVWTSPLMGADAGRETAWRARRRATLRQLPKLVSRTLCYTVALLLILNEFGVEILPLSLAVGAVALLFGAALIPQMRDAAQGYALLSEDALAPGDLIEANGHTGVIEKLSLRGVWLRDREGKMHLLSHRDLTSLIIHARHTDTAQELKGSKESGKEGAPRTMAYDPLAEEPRPPAKGIMRPTPARSGNGSPTPGAPPSVTPRAK